MSNVDDVREISEWFNKFKVGAYIDYTDMNLNECVLKKSDFIKDIITYLSKNYKSFSDDKKSQNDEESNKNDNNEKQMIVRTIINTNC